MARSKHAVASVGFTCLLLPFAASAELQWDGFISAGGGIADPDSGSELAGFEDKFTFDTDTVLGLQVRGAINEKLSATGQIVARGSEDFDPDMAWAYLSYEATEKLTAKLGRIRLPFYLYSDFLEVGYAYHWISPPAEVYFVPVDSTNGFDLVYSTNFGRVDASLQGYFGSFDKDIDSEGTAINISARDQVGLVATGNYDWLTLRGSVHQSKVNLGGFGETALPAPFGSIDNLAATLNGLPSFLVGAAGSEVANNLSADDVTFLYSEFALKAEYNNWLFVTEFTRLKSDSGPLADQNRAFASIAYTMDDWTVHFTQGRADDDAADVSGSLPVIPGVTDGLIQLVDGIADGFADESTTNTIGLRYDFTAGAAFKIEYSDVDDKKGVDGNIVRFVVDAVF
jgi:hypothetical protein